jgi:ribonuclease HI
MTRRQVPHRGARLFEDHTASAVPRHTFYIAQIDGAARGNPGPASYGVVVRAPDGAVAAELRKQIGRATNNVAEYYALIAALDYAAAHGIRALRIESDSLLLVNQMRGRYKVKSADLRPLFERARKMSQELEAFAIEHVPRERNRAADALANQALDGVGSGGGTAAAKSKMRNSKTETRSIRARYSGGALHPVQPLDLPDGAEVELTVRIPDSAR